MKTVQQLAYELLGHTEIQDIGALTARDGMELAGAINSGIGEFLDLAPDRFGQSSASEVIFAPQTITLTVTNGAAEVDSGDENTFPVRWQGCSIEIGDDATMNEIVDGKGFLNAYQGTSGSVSAKVYSDAVPMQERYVQNLCSDPWLEMANERQKQLVRSSHEHAPSQTYGNSQGGYWGIDYGWHWSLGEPVHYALQHTGISRSASSQFLIRLFPVPNEVMTLRYELNLEPISYTLADITGSQAVLLPLSDHQLATMVSPLCRRALLATSLINNEAPVAQIERSAERAETLIRKLPRDAGIPQGRVGTPDGW